MPVHVIAISDIISYPDGVNPQFLGRRVLEHFPYPGGRTYSETQPGESFQAEYMVSPVRFESPESFSADLEISGKVTYDGAYIALHNKSLDLYYPMFLSDFESMAKRAIITRGKVSGHFGYVKKGTKFGVQYLRDLQPDEKTFE